MILCFGTVHFLMTTILRKINQQIEQPRVFLQYILHNKKLGEVFEIANYIFFYFQIALTVIAKSES
jgi:hypothetical protein